MPRISHFDIPVNDPKRPQNFYRDVFDWKFEKWDGLVDLDCKDRNQRIWN